MIRKMLQEQVKNSIFISEGLSDADMATQTPQRLYGSRPDGRWDYSVTNNFKKVECFHQL